MTKKGTVTIASIAKALNVSIGTVDRALHNRPEIKPETRAMILAKAKEMDYEVNILAQALSRKKALRIGVLLPNNDTTVKYFYRDVKKGIDIASRELQDNRVEIVYEQVCGFDPVDQNDALKSLLQRGVDGIIFNAAYPDIANEMIREAARINIPSITIGTDAPESERLCFVTAGSYAVGCIAGELMCNFTKERGRFVVFTGFNQFIDNENKAQGFVDTVRKLTGDIHAVDVVETYATESYAYSCASKVLTDVDGIAGIYVNTANSVGVCQRINELPGAKDIPLIVTDLFPDMLQYMNDGTINATIFQNPIQQGKRAIHIMYTYLAGGKRLGKIETVRPELIMRANLCYYDDVLCE